MTVTKGGARSRSGPPPDLNALRRLRKDDAGWTILPSEGREAPAPEWPLPDPTLRELEVWDDLWTTRAVALLWERAQATRAVAFYVRISVQAEQPRARTEIVKMVPRLEANLYLTPDSQLRARIRIAADDVAEKRESSAPARRSSSRDRLKVVDGNGA